MLCLLLVFALVLGQCCQAQPRIAVLNVTEGSCVSVPCEFANGSSSLIQWLRDADVDGVAEQKISCSGSKCKITECDNGQKKTEQGRYNILPNGTLQISRVHMNDSGLYRCLKQTRQVSLTRCNSTPSLCASREQHFQQGDSAAQDHWHTTFLLSISALPQQEYKVSVHTGDWIGSGTNANMFIYLCGEFTCVTSELKTSTRDPFENGKTDEFVVYGPYLGHLTHLKIWHDGAGILSSWFLKRVTVKEPQSGMSYTFTCHCWIYGNSRKNLSTQEQPKDVTCSLKHKEEGNEPSTDSEVKPLQGFALLSCELHEHSGRNSLLLWMLRGAGGSSSVQAVAGKQAEALAPCLKMNTQGLPQMLERGNHSCPESSHCLLLPRSITPDERKSYWCLVGPEKDGMWRRKIPSVVSFTPDPWTEGNSNNVDRNITQQNTTKPKEEKTTMKEQSTLNLSSSDMPTKNVLVAIVIFSIIGLLSVVLFLYLLIRIYGKGSRREDDNVSEIPINNIFPHIPKIIVQQTKSSASPTNVAGKTKQSKNGEENNFGKTINLFSITDDYSTVYSKIQFTARQTREDPPSQGDPVNYANIQFNKKLAVSSPFSDSEYENVSPQGSARKRGEKRNNKEKECVYYNASPPGATERKPGTEYPENPDYDEPWAEGF